MEVLLSAVASDIVSRLVSFLISKFQEAGSTDDDVVRLQRALLRARVVVEEAEARQVSNRAMLLQLNQLRGEMCRGSYVLDAFMRRAVDPCRGSHAMASRSPAGLAERLESGSTRTGGQVISAVLNTLEAALSDMKEEFVVLLGACPRLNRQPYCAYLFMERCMFGRQMEKEQIIGFLLQPAQDFDVLPIIGPHEVGKRTLVEHACLDDRVRDHYAKIHHLTSDDLDLQSPDDHGRHQGLIDSASAAIFVIDLAGGDGDEEEERWRRFRSSMRRRTHRESKIIIISRTERHSALGTVPPLRLRAPRREELWYLFKALSFGGADPEERPELVRIAMVLFNNIPDLAPFAVANKLAAALRADLSARSWRRVLKVSTGVVELQLGAAAGGPRRPEEKTGYYYPSVPMKDAPNAPCVFYGRRKSTGMARSELPKVTMMEVSEGVIDRGEKRFDVLVWQSRIPPYASYVATCDMEGGADVAPVVGTKRRLNKRRRGQLVHGFGSNNNVGG
ncbi:disease resistance protein RGA2-like [Miscanthus floridulus]|uniref:disease resistance protein RGA2-like n=1 Tax=Miscanthus floridulus TaxID=154761 RepID=UPI00345A7993